MCLPKWLRRKKNREIGVVFTMPYNITDDRVQEIFESITKQTTNEITSFMVVMK